LIIFILLISCTLKRSNPLDPNGHDIDIPPNVVLTILGEYVESGDYTKSINNYVEMEWNNDPSGIDGYYIYRSMDHDGLYILVTTQNHIPSDEHIQTYRDHDIVPGNWYFYKISAFNAEGLEGFRSNWKLTWVVD